MKVVVTRLLNRRIGSPTLNAKKLTPLEEGVQIEVVQNVTGDNLFGNDIWHKTEEGWYVWSGGVYDSRIGWGLRTLGIPQIWVKTKGKGIKIAILDTGVDLKNSDLNKAVIACHNMITGTIDVQDTDGHGTHCASIIASRGNNKMIGIAPESSLIIIKIAENSLSFNADHLNKGIQKAIDSGADILSLSLGSSLENSVTSQLIKQSITKGKIFVAAAGNLTPHILFPADMPGMISVSSASINNRQANYGEGSFKLGVYKPNGPKNEQHEGITLTAPGDYIDVYGKESDFVCVTGSSFAAPYVAGVIALLLTIKPNLSHLEVRKSLMDTALKDVQAYSVEYWGAGLINPLGLIL
jgi:subtilisin family serine protease